MVLDLKIRFSKSRRGSLPCGRDRFTRDVCIPKNLSRLSGKRCESWIHR